jgi:hypothetical protein
MALRDSPGSWENGEFSWLSSVTACRTVSVATRFLRLHLRGSCILDVDVLCWGYLESELGDYDKVVPGCGLTDV